MITRDLLEVIFSDCLRPILTGQKFGSHGTITDARVILIPDEWHEPELIIEVRCKKTPKGRESKWIGYIYS